MPPEKGKKISLAFSSRLLALTRKVLVASPSPPLGVSGIFSVSLLILVCTGFSDTHFTTRVFCLCLPKES